MTSTEYYYQQFREHFQEFWSAIPSSEGFRLGSLQKRNGLDVLAHIPREDLSYFLSSLACTILIDQVMYTYFPNDYSDFREMTKYPKMTTAWIHTNPWMIFDQKIILPRKIHTNQVLEVFKDFSGFFIKDLESFFSKNKFQEATWQKVRVSMLSDLDVGRGLFGQVFVKNL